MRISKKVCVFLCFFIFTFPYTFAQLETLDELKQISEKVQSLVSFLKERTVAIKITVGDRTGYGSGAIISSDGLIVTCAHVAEISNRLSVIMADGKEYNATKLGMNSINDYALLKIDASNLAFFELGNSADLKVMQWAIALGHPGGPYPDKQPAVAAGKIRGLHKKLPIEFGSKFYNDAIQTDIPIFAGNSGGPLVDLDGKLIGINGAVMLMNDLAFAVPIDQISINLPELKRGQNVQGEFPGNIFELLKIFMELQNDVSPEDMEKLIKETPLGKILQLLGGGEIPAQPPMPLTLGVMFRVNNTVQKVEENSLGEMAGFLKGDQVVSVDGKKYETIFELKPLIDSLSIGNKLVFKILRNGVEKEITLIFDKKAYTRDRCLQRALAYQGLEAMESTVKIGYGNDLLGYGVIVSSDGWVLTNCQILGSHPNVTVKLQHTQKTYPARVVGTHGILDVAMIKFQPDVTLKPVRIGDETQLKIGEWVFSGGNENGVIQASMVSALKREVPGERRIPTLGLFGLLGKPNKSPLRAYDNVIHHDSNMESYHFGTPLMNLKGELVGINAGHFYRSTTFAIPISSIKEVMNDLKEGKSVPITSKYMPYKPQLDPISRLFEYFLESEKKTESLGDIFRDMFKEKREENKGFLGVRVEQDKDGVRVAEAMDGYAAQRAGIQENDIIIEINKQKIDSVVTLLEKLQSMTPGTEVCVRIRRKEADVWQEKTFWIVLDKRP